MIGYPSFTLGSFQSILLNVIECSQQYKPKLG